MFSEALNCYTACCKRYAAAYPDVVGESNMQHLMAVGGSLSSLGSICTSVARNAKDRASTLSKMLAGRDKSINELLKDIDAELGCDANHGFSPVIPPSRTPFKEGESSHDYKDPAPRRSHIPIPQKGLPPRTPSSPPPSDPRAPSKPRNPEYRPQERVPIESERKPLRTPTMPAPQSLDNVSLALSKQYRENFDLYKNTVERLIRSCDDILNGYSEIDTDLQAIQYIARELDSVMRRPILAVDAINKRIATRDALVKRVKELRNKLETLSRRFRQRQSLHCTDVDVCELDSIIYQHQKIFGKKGWFVNLRNKLESFKSFLGSSDARTVAERLERLNSTLDGVANNLKAAAIRINSEINAEKGRRAAVDAVKARLTVALRNAQVHYQRIAPKSKLVFQTTSTQTGTHVSPTAEELRKDVTTAMTPLWQQLSVACQQIDKLQKDILRLSPSDLNMTKAFPAYIIIGGVRIQCETSTIAVPILTTFPFAKPRLFRDIDQIASFLLRLIYAMPIGGIRLNIIDHAAVGAHGRYFNQLLDVSGDIVKLITVQDDIRGLLQELLTYMGDLAKTKFTGAVTSWMEYNKNNPTAPLPCTLLVIYSFKGWEYREVELLEPILERGAQCGVFVVGLSDGLSGLDERLRKGIRPERFVVMPPDLGRSGFAYKKLSATWQPLSKLSLGQWEKLMISYKDAYEAKISRTTHAFADLYSDVPFWSCNSSEGLDAIIGWDASDVPLHFRLGFGKESLNHAIMCGKTGGGKTNLLHAIIRSFCFRYSPEEFELYLLDFKDGVGFNPYADKGRAWLPHARTISVHNDPNYAVSMFEAIVAEMERRNGEFKSAVVEGIKDYRLKTRKKMSRILIIVDEAKDMFAPGEWDEKISKLVLLILRKGRSAGIHLLLSTQSTASISIRGFSEMLQQLVVRFALPGDGDEGVLSNVDRSIVQSIRIPQCVFNDNGGAPDCNRIFAHPQLIDSDASYIEYRRKMEDGTTRLGGWSRFPSRVFDGRALPLMPSNDRFTSLLAESATRKKRFDLVLGIHSDFAGNVCRVTFEDEAAEDHLLVAYEKDDRSAAKGLWESILKSLAVLPNKAVLLYDPKRSGPLPIRLPGGFDEANADTERSELLRKLKALQDSTAVHKVLIVENFDSARYLHQKNSSPLSWGEEDVSTTESTDTLFKAAFEDSENIPFHVICFTRRARFAMEKLGNAIMSKISKRIAFSLNGDDLIELMSQARGMDVRDKVLFSDESSPDGIIDILPFKSTLKV